MPRGDASFRTHMIIGLLRCRRFRMETSGVEMKWKQNIYKLYPCSRKNIGYSIAMAVAVFPCTVKTSTDAKSFKLNCGQDSSKIANHAYGTPALPSIAVYIHANASMQRYWRQSQKPTSHRKCLGRARYPMLLSSVMISQTKLDTSLAPLLTNCVMN